MTPPRPVVPGPGPRTGRKGQPTPRHLFLALPIALLAPALLAGCHPENTKDARAPAPTERSVTHQALIRETDLVYEQETDQKYIHPEPFAGNRTPNFPSLPDARWPSGKKVSIVVTLVADESGKVTDVRPRDDYGADERSPFFEQVAAACLDWRFTPLKVRTTRVVPDGKVFGLPKVRVVTDEQGLPFSVDYEFLFSEHGVVKDMQRK